MPDLTVGYISHIFLQTSFEVDRSDLSDAVLHILQNDSRGNLPNCQIAFPMKTMRLDVIDYADSEYEYEKCC